MGFDPSETVGVPQRTWIPKAKPSFESYQHRGLCCPGVTGQSGTVHLNGIGRSLNAIVHGDSGGSVLLVSDLPQTKAGRNKRSQVRQPGFCPPGITINPIDQSVIDRSINPALNRVISDPGKGDRSGNFRSGQIRVFTAFSVTTATDYANTSTTPLGLCRHTPPLHSEAVSGRRVGHGSKTPQVPFAAGVWWCGITPEAVTWLSILS